MKTLRNLAFAGTLAAVAAVGVMAPAQAQRDPAYAAARTAGQVGERNDGYLGVVGQETPQLRRLVNDINIKRRAVYTQRAAAEKATVEQYAKAAACQAIARTSPGEKYQAPDGSWQTRTSAAPQRDPACT
jgi:uncharacterized protein YdbL (DUF1318 family)